MHIESFHNFHFLNLQVIFFIVQVGKLEEVNWLFAAMKGESVTEPEIDTKASSLLILVYIMRNSFLLINTFNDKSFWNCWLGKILKHTCFQWWKFPKLDMFWWNVLDLYVNFVGQELCNKQGNLKRIRITKYVYSFPHIWLLSLFNPVLLCEL